MKGNKALTRPERRTATQDNTCWETNKGRQGTNKTGEEDTTTKGII